MSNIKYLLLNNHKIKELHHTKLKRIIQDVYAHARNLHAAQYDRVKAKFFDAEAIIITNVEFLKLEYLQSVHEVPLKFMPYHIR